MQRFTLLCAFVALGAVAVGQESSSAPAEPRQQSLLSRLRSQSSTRQQLEQKPVEVAQPATNQQSYQPGITYPQVQQAPPQPMAPPPGYPPPPQGVPYNVQPSQPQQGGQRPAGARPTQTPTGSSRSSSSRNSDDSQPSTRSGSSSRSSSRASSGGSTKADQTPAARKASSSERNTSSNTANPSDSEESSSRSTSSNSANSSALEKIVKKVESGSKADEQPEKPVQVKQTKEEIEAAKARDAALREADKATTVVASFLKLANDGFYTKANNHLAPAIKKYFESEISAVNGTEKAVLDELTGNGNITMVTYVNTTVRGEGAVVEAELGYQDGRTTRRSFDLIQLDGDWKIVLPVSAGSPSQANASSPVASSAPAAAPPVSAIPTAEQAAATAPPAAPASQPADAATTLPR